MGITIVQCSDLSQRRPHAKTALVLAGGAVSGGAYKLGGLKALNDFLINKKVTDFDTYVGLSAGALLSAAIANGVPPEEMLQSLTGTSSRFEQLKPWDFYWPNLREIVTKPAEFLAEILMFSPVAAVGMMVSSPQVRRKMMGEFKQVLREPTYQNFESLIQSVTHELSRRLEIPDPVKGLIPSAFFDNSRLERYLARNVQADGMSNDFKQLYMQRGKELYVTAMKLDTAERAVFGHDEVSEYSISQAVQASTALPGFYKPVRLGGIDYVDGGVIKTANIDVAEEKGAELIVVYNPFRPLFNPVDYVNDPRVAAEYGSKRVRRLADEGLPAIINQVFRTLLHTRLQNGLELYRRDPNFKGDIIVVEPTIMDQKFFDTNPLAFWLRAQSAQDGFESVTRSIEKRFDEIRRILRAYGIEISRHFVRSDLQKIKAAYADDDKILEILESQIERKPIRLAGSGGS